MLVSFETKTLVLFRTSAINFEHKNSVPDTLVAKKFAVFHQIRCVDRNNLPSHKVRTEKYKNEIDNTEEK